ncbi:MAG TPA: DUF4350 domain-containing protein [Acidimicrobiales bacterium]|nr:DUF4350 domain-containing protein [Acidimicrobiales bacterium]
MSVVGVAEPSHGGTAEAWGRLPFAVRALVVVVAGVLVVEFLGSLFGSVIGSRTAPTAATSPTATGPSGTAGLVALLARAGHAVSLPTSPPAASAVPGGATLLVLDPRRFGGADRVLARAVVAARGRVVFVGAAPGGLAPLLPRGVAVTLVDQPAGRITSTARGALSFGVTSLVTGRGVLRTTGPVHVDVQGAGGTFVASAGRLVWVASSVPLRNASLGQVDDAALAWNLAAPRGRPVVLDAWDSAPAPTASGLEALPAWWVAALAVVGLAIAVWLASAARRFGPLESRARALAPARAGHAVAMGALLAAMPADRVTEASAPVVLAARRSLLRALRLDQLAAPAQIDEDAADRGIPEWVVRGATTSVATRDDAVAAGRALAWLTAERATR